MTIKQRKQSISLFQTIETLPIWNWEQVKKTGDRRFLLVLDNYDVLPDVGVADDHWLMLQGEFQEKVGNNGMGGHYMDKFMDLQRVMRDEIIYGCDEVITGERHPNMSRTKTNRKLLERELDQVPVVNQTIEDQAIQLEIFFQREFDTRKMSVFKWHKYMNEYERRIEELQRSEKNQS